MQAVWNRFLPRRRMSVTGHVLVLFLICMVSSFPITVRNNLDRLPIIQATLVTEKGMSSPPQTVVTVQRKADVEKKEVIKPRVIPKTSEQKTNPVPFPVDFSTGSGERQAVLHRQ